MDFEPTGNLESDLALCIEHGNTMTMDYVDAKGNSSTRHVLPIEIRGDRCYFADLDKMGLRVFILSNIGSYEVLDEVVDKDSLTLK